LQDPLFYTVDSAARPLTTSKQGEKHGVSTKQGDKPANNMAAVAKPGVTNTPTNRGTSL